MFAIYLWPSDPSRFAPFSSSRPSAPLLSSVPQQRNPKSSPWTSRSKLSSRAAASSSMTTNKFQTSVFFLPSIPILITLFFNVPFNVNFADQVLVTVSIIISALRTSYRIGRSTISTGRPLRFRILLAFYDPNNDSFVRAEFSFHTRRSLN